MAYKKKKGRRHGKRTYGNGFKQGKTRSKYYEVSRGGVRL